MLSGHTLIDLMRSLLRWLFPVLKWKEEGKEQQRFSQDVYVALRRGGWYSGRVVPLPPGANESDYIEMALAVLHEFGDLHFGESFPSPTDLDIFASDEFEIDWRPEERTCFEKLQLSPIGLWLNLPIFIDSAGCVYWLRNGLDPVAKPFERFLEVILQELEPTENDLLGARIFKHVAGTRFVFEEALNDTCRPA